MIINQRGNEHQPQQRSSIQPVTESLPLSGDEAEIDFRLSSTWSLHPEGLEIQSPIFLLFLGEEGSFIFQYAPQAGMRSPFYGFNSDVMGLSYPKLIVIQLWAESGQRCLGHPLEVVLITILFGTGNYL